MSHFLIKSLLSLFRPAPEDVAGRVLEIAPSPDQLIGSRVMASMIRDLSKWSKEWVKPYPSSNFRVLKGPAQDGSEVVLRFKDDPYGTFHYEGPVDFTINDVPLDPTVGRQIVATYERLRAAFDNAEAAQREAVRQMEENEKKWDLAERLFGMKRTPEGALVSAMPAQ